MTRAFHPVAAIFPMMEGREFKDLVADVRRYGLRESIWLHRDGRILDGRNRYLACREASVEPTFRTYGGSDADVIPFIVSHNLHRRHLNESQRGMVAAKIANFPRGRPEENPPIGGFSTADAAQMLNVGTRTIERARTVRDHGAPELIDVVEQGRVSVSAAADVATLPQEEQAEIVARGEIEILEAAKEIRCQKARKNAAARAAVQAAALKIDPPTGKYRTIVIDPPWPMQKIEREVRPNQVGFDYPTMSESQLAAFAVPDMAHDQCHLFLWTTQKFLPMAFRLFDAWGFPYSFTMVWHKPGGFQPVGLPQYNCEFVLFGRRGALEFLDTAAFATCFSAPRREHSRKPDAFYDLVRRVSPGPRIDVFARERRDGFDAWGAETGKFGGAA